MSELGFFEGFTGPTYTAKKPEKLEVKRVRTEQSNSSLLIGSTLILKLFRHLEAGLNPDFEICRHVRNIGGFENVPAVAGRIDYRPHDAPEFYTFALLQEFVQNQGDGWSYTIEELRRYYDRAIAKAPLLDKVQTEDRVPELVDKDIPEEMYELLGVYLKDANTLGKRTGELHAELGRDTRYASFRAETMTKDDLIDISFSIRRDIDQMLQQLERAQNDLPNDVTAAARKLVGMRGKIQQFVTRLPTIRSKVQKIRCHGDFHLGQTLYANGDFFIFDFEGEPAKPLAMRREKHSPLKDVASMLRSFSYAAYASLFLFTHNRQEDYDRLLPWAKVCEKWVSVSFLNGYLTAVQGQKFAPQDRTDFFRMLLPFVVDKAFYEIGYELNNRPDWIKIPVNSLLDYLHDNIIDRDI
jgi:maltose alpha-D-glucosyltransferase/alpha-amylase